MKNELLKAAVLIATGVSLTILAAGFSPAKAAEPFIFTPEAIGSVAGVRGWVYTHCDQLNENRQMAEVINSMIPGVRKANEALYQAGVNQAVKELDALWASIGPQASCIQVAMISNGLYTLKGY